MKHYVFLTKKYPNIVDRNTLSFVQQLVWSIADQGIKCSVLCPVPANLNVKYLRLGKHETEKTEKGSLVDVYYPRYFGLGDSHLIFGKSPIRFTTYTYQKAVEKVIRSIGVPDVIYGHFIAPPGITAATLGKKYQIPSFFAYGEAYPIAVDWYGKERVREAFKNLSGVIAVSTKNKNEIVECGVVNSDKVRVFPNGYREERFFPRDKLEARKKFGFSADDFIVSFVGSFDNRKGILRLDEAINGTENCKVAYAGRGDLKPTSKNCLWAAPVDNEELPYFLSASDVFVLPTLSEGCCNAIIEAMACGLPIISSDRSFNDDILDNSCSIRVNPESVEELKAAIEKLYADKELRRNLSKGSLEKAQKLTLKQRADNICAFIESKSCSVCPD